LDPPFAFWTAEFTFWCFSPITTAFSIFWTLIHSQAHRIAARKVPRHIDFDFRQCTTFLVALFRSIHPYRVFFFYRIFDISSTYAPIDASHLIPEGSSTSNIDLQHFTKVFAALFRLILINLSFGPPRSLFRPSLHISGRFSHRFSRLRTRYRLNNVPQPVDIDFEQLRTPSPHIHPTTSSFRVFQHFRLRFLC